MGPRLISVTGWFLTCAGAAADLVAGHEHIIRDAHPHGLRVYGGTVMPFGRFAAYATPESEADRQEVNRWIRTSGAFDAVNRFQRDHLHLSAAGYGIIARAIDLGLFADPSVP